MKKHFTKELAVVKENKRHFRRANKCHLCNKSYFEKDIYKYMKI